MNSASILLNFSAPAPVAAPVTAAAAGVPASGAEQPPAAAAGFNQALAAAQAGSTKGASAPEADAEPLELASGLLLRSAGPDAPVCLNAAIAVVDGADADADADASVDALESGAAAILAQMLMGSAPPPPPAAPSAEEASVEPALMQATNITAGKSRSADQSDVVSETDASGISLDGSQGDVAETALRDLPAAVASPAVLEKTPDASAVTQPPQASQVGNATPSGNALQAAVQAAASVQRESAPDPVSTPVVHATLRETVGTARWADELGNRMVLMSVRGQQQGSLTLTPEHLGPVEVQISMNKDTANVWFGAQHAETRAALADAMPRLRELLASSGLSLGQSGVSEQTPRDQPAPSPAAVGRGSATPDADAVAAPAAWRRWSPGLVDTYA